MPPSSSSTISGWDVHSCLRNRQPVSLPLCNTWWPGSSTNQTGKIWKKKFLCVWSAAVELTTTDCPWCIIDTDWVLCTIEDFSVFQSLRTGHHHSASVVFARTQIYLVYLLIYCYFYPSGRRRHHILNLCMHSFIHPLPDLWTLYSENEWTDFDASWYKWSMDNCMRWSIIFGGQEVKAADHTRLMIDLQAWQRQHCQPFGLNSFSSLYRLDDFNNSAVLFHYYSVVL